MTLTTVDAFASGPFTGNPAAVCVLDAPAPEAWMQAIAGEMNLSETAFVVPEGETFALRWFTPTVEVDLCGHATLASAHVLYESGLLAAGDVARFDTASGRLTVTMAAPGRYTMDFPATPPTAAPVDALAEVVGASPTWTGRSRFDVFVVLDDPDAVRALEPDMATVAALESRGLIVTARAEADAGIDVVSRFFAPQSGVAEDPVTGSAHCAIGPYWTRELGVERVACYQASRRGGRVDVSVFGDRVALTGDAVTVYRAELAAAARPVALLL